MKMHPSVTLVAATLAVLFGAPSVRAQFPEPLGNPTGPIEFAAGQQNARVVPFVGGLSHPWSIAFLPDGTMLVTELPGRLRIVRNGVLDPRPAWTAPPAPGPDPDDNNARVRAVAVHPQFAQNRLVYLSHVKWGERGNTLAVSRGRLEGGALRDVEEIFVAEAWEASGNLGGRMLFGPDNTLYVTVGDRDRLCCIGRDDNSLRMKAQSLDNHVGKTLRLRDDGGVPADNPFVGRADARPEIFTYGHRNGYGLSFHPETGALWQAEIGPLGGDEVNVLEPGGNYGWPLVSMGRNYTGTRVSEQPWFRPDMVPPQLFWVPAISPSSIVFYTGDKFPAWKNSLLVGALTTRQLQRVSWGNPSQEERREILLAPLGLRVRDVAQGPDGYIYVATEPDRRPGTTDGAILRIEPAGP